MFWNGAQSSCRTRTTVPGAKVFIGFLLTFAFLSLILYVVAQDKVFLYHALLQFGVFIYLLEFFSVMLDLSILRDSPVLIQAVIYFALCLMDVSYLQFIRTFLKIWEKYPFWDRFVQGLIVVRVMVLALTLIIFYGYRDMQLGDDISAFYMVGEYLGMVILLFFIRESGPQRLFLIGGTALLSVGIVSNALSVVAGTGIQFSEGYRIRDLVRMAVEGNAQNCRPSDGSRCLPAYDPSVSYRRIQEWQRCWGQQASQLDYRACSVRCNSPPVVYRLFATVGPTCILGDYCRHEHRKRSTGCR